VARGPAIELEIRTLVCRPEVWAITPGQAQWMQPVETAATATSSARSGTAGVRLREPLRGNAEKSSPRTPTAGMEPMTTGLDRPDHCAGSDRAGDSERILDGFCAREEGAGP